MHDQISAGVNPMMSGIPNWTAFDIGGFAVEQRYSSQDPAHVAEWREMNTRWFQFRRLRTDLPLHGEFPPREIWNIAPPGTEVYNTLVYYDRLRYRLMPYIYTIAADTYHRDSTMMRGLVMDFPNDVNVRDIDDQYMFGPSFLVNPVTEFRRAAAASICRPARAGTISIRAKRMTAANALMRRRRSIACRSSCGQDRSCRRGQRCNTPGKISAGRSRVHLHRRQWLVRHLRR